MATSGRGIPRSTCSQRPSRTADSMSSGRCSGKDVAGFGPVPPFVALALPMLPARRTVSHLRRERCTAFREPLHFIVITVTVDTLPMSKGFLRDDPLPGSPCTVTPIVIEKSPYLCGSLRGVTMMTLVTVSCKDSLGRPTVMRYLSSQQTPARTRHRWRSAT